MCADFKADKIKVIIIYPKKNPLSNYSKWL